MAVRTPTRSVSSESLPSCPSAPAVDLSPIELSPAELSPAEHEKEALVRAACGRRDLGALVRLATSTHGLVSDRVRCTAWPLLLGCSDADAPPTSWQSLPEHRDEHQVGLDVARAFVYYPSNESEKQLARLREELSDVIVAVLRRHPMLCYFQGYHDIVQVLLLVLGAEQAPVAAARLSLLRLRDFMLSSLEPALSQLELLRPILRAADPVLYDHLPEGNASFALAGTMTMFAHNIQNYSDITRLFDFFLAHHAVMPVYLFAAVVLSRRDELLEIEREDEDILYAVLGRLPQPFDVEFYLARTVELYDWLPPEVLRSWEWWKISSSSVLKTSATTFDLHRLTLQDGEEYFAQQEKHLQRQKAMKQALDEVKYAKKYVEVRLWYYRRYGAVGLAILVGAYALWLGRNGGSISMRYPLFGRLGDFMRRTINIAV